MSIFDDLESEIVTVSYKDGFVTFYDVRGVMICWTREKNQVSVLRNKVNWVIRPTNVEPGDIIKRVQNIVQYGD